MLPLRSIRFCNHNNKKTLRKQSAGSEEEATRHGDTLLAERRWDDDEFFVCLQKMKKISHSLARLFRREYIARASSLFSGRSVARLDYEKSLTSFFSVLHCARSSFFLFSSFFAISRVYIWKRIHNETLIRFCLRREVSIYSRGSRSRSHCREFVVLFFFCIILSNCGRTIVDVWSSRESAKTQDDVER